MKVKNKTSVILDKKSVNKRDVILSKQLRRVGKVGGVVDARFGSRDRKKTDAEKSLQRHIVEKLRRMDEVGYEVDATDPLNIAAFSDVDGRRAELFRLDEDADTGIPSDIVDKQFFTTGSNSKDFKDALAETIALSKLQKLKRIEENEEQRDRVKQADDGWSHKIRFMLTNLASLKPKKVSKKAATNQKLVCALLGQLTDDKRIPPADFKSTGTDFEKQLIKLQSAIDISDQSSISVNLDDSRQLVNVYKPEKSVGNLLRLLLQMPEHEKHSLIYIAEKFSHVNPRSLNDVVHLLLLLQLLLEHCQSKATKLSGENSSCSLKSTGLLVPEIAMALVKLWKMAAGMQTSGENHGNLAFFVAGPHLKLGKELVDPPSLNLAFAEPSSTIPAEDRTTVHLSAINRLLSLSLQAVTLFERFLPRCVCAFVFQPMLDACRAVDTSCFTAKMRGLLEQIITSIVRCAEAPTPKHLLSTMRLNVLNAEQTTTETVRTLKKIGLLPQLEPRFDDRLDARHPKKTNVKRLLQRKLSKEKRGAMREIRRDGQFLAVHQLKETKASDEARKQKTQAILNSLRSIED